MRAARCPALAKLASALLVVGGAGIVAGANVEKIGHHAIKTEADQQKAGGGALGAAAHAVGAQTNPEPTGVEVGVHVAVQVAAPPSGRLRLVGAHKQSDGARPQPDPAKVDPELFAKWEKLLEAWGRLEDHFGHLLGAEQLHAKWHQHEHAFGPVMASLSNAAERFRGMLIDPKEDPCQVKEAVDALHQLIEKTFDYVTDHVILQHAYAIADEEMIKQELDQIAESFKIEEHLVQITNHVSGSEALKAEWERLHQVADQVGKWLRDGQRLAEKERHFVQEAARSKQDLDGTDLQKFVSNTVEKETALEGEFQRAVLGQAAAGGFTGVLLQQSAEGARASEAAAEAPVSSSGGSAQHVAISAPSSDGHRQRRKACARGGDASGLKAKIKAAVGGPAKAAIKA